MSLDIIKLFTDYSIPIWTEGNNCQEGWVNTTCPFCDDHSNHLGYSLDENRFNCWKCGGHLNIDTISKLLRINREESIRILKTYGGTFVSKSPNKKILIRRHSFKLPSNTEELSQRHKSYLEMRGFDPDYIIREWNVLGTGPVSYLDKREYKHRIIIPFYWDDKIVSFQGRDITGKHSLRYKSCPEDRELVHYKDIVYGKQNRWKDTGICVEGPTDVWRFGPRSFATCSITFTRAQIRAIAKAFKRVAVVYDNQPQALARAEQLVNELSFRRVDAFIVRIEGDPGEMDQKEANYLVKQIL